MRKHTIVFSKNKKRTNVQKEKKLIFRYGKKKVPLKMNDFFFSYKVKKIQLKYKIM